MRTSVGVLAICPRRSSISVSVKSELMKSEQNQNSSDVSAVGVYTWRVTARAKGRCEPEQVVVTEPAR